MLAIVKLILRPLPVDGLCGFDPRPIGLDLAFQHLLLRGLSRFPLGLELGPSLPRGLVSHVRVHRSRLELRQPVEASHDCVRTDGTRARSRLGSSKRESAVGPAPGVRVASRGSRALRPSAYSESDTDGRDGKSRVTRNWKT